MDELIEIATRILSQHWRDPSTNMSLDRQRMLAGHVVPAIAAKALRDAADAWQAGAWAETPRYADPVADRLSSAQFAYGWLRARADQVEQEATR